jgi:tripartite-type tricarboxylate transporter receptor subunit TctC
VPTFREIGYDITMGVYYMVIGPKGLSPEIVSKLHDAFKKGMGEPVFIEAMKARGFDVSYEGSEDLKRRLKKDYEQNAKLVDMLKLKSK